ncbi:MAG: hypothetical protein AAGG51_18070 [Cyanobacteria bacterium P01_G01_bin.54]
MSYIPAALHRLVIQRANNCCEFCQLPDDVEFYPHEFDHVIAQKYDGTTEKGL